MPEIGPMYAEIGPMSVPRWPRSGRYWANIVWLSGKRQSVASSWGFCDRTAYLRHCWDRLIKCHNRDYTIRCHSDMTYDIPCVKDNEYIGDI